jgi:hypothetical protein
LLTFADFFGLDPTPPSPRTGTGYVAGKNILAVTVLVNDKYFKMHEAAKHSLSKF